MNALQFAFYLTGAALICIEEPSFLLVFCGVILLYLVMACLYPGVSAASNRRKIMFASWSGPEEGIIRAKIQINMQNTLQFLQSYPEEEKPSILNIVCKAGAQVMKDAEDLNGKIVFGKFLKFKHVNLGLLADLGEGKEMVNLMMERCQTKSIEEIRDQMNMRMENARRAKAETTQLGRWIPTLFMGFFLKVLQFVTGDLNISIPFLGIKSNPYGSAMLHSLEAIDCNDASAPFLGYSGCSVQLTINKIHEKVVVEDQKPKVARVMIANFVVDHRYLDGAKAKKMIPNFLKVFENPSAYSSRKNESNTSEERIKRSD